MLPALHEGTLFAGRYRIVRCIAAGAMGAVYEVVHVDTERRRALKVMLQHTAQDPELRERFKREARIAAHVNSEHIVEVFDAGVDDTTGMPFLVMELLRGEELGERLKRLGQLPAVDVVTYLHQAALALDRTHEASIVHRDLKPANLFLTHRDDGTPRIKLLDFGVAKLLAEGTGKLAATVSVGTPLYMAPEQLVAGAISPATDIYALGMIAYALLTGKEYWVEEVNRGGGVVAFALTAIKGPPEPATVRAARLGVTLPPAFDAWFAHATAPDAAARFPTAGAAVHALAPALGMAPLSDSGPRFAPTARGGAAPADSGAGSGPLAAASREQPPGSRRRLAPIAVAVAAAGALFGAGLIYKNAFSGSGAPATAITASEEVAPIPAAPAPSAAAPPQVAPAAAEAPPSAATSSTSAATPMPAAPPGARGAGPQGGAAGTTRLPPPPTAAPTVPPRPSVPPRIYSPD